MQAYSFERLKVEDHSSPGVTAGQPSNTVTKIKILSNVKDLKNICLHYISCFTDIQKAFRKMSKPAERGDDTAKENANRISRMVGNKSQNSKYTVRLINLENFIEL